MKQYIKLTFFLIQVCLLNYENSFQFSVIIPIFNTGRYLDDSIGSLINQSIDFSEIQVILVNDGSTDQTEEICLKYKQRFPKNIEYIKIEHNGVSKARNIGLDYANGTYINFLDPDDKWDYNAFKIFLLFFKYYKNINIISGRMKFFEAANGYHPLDYKFYKTRIVNLTEEYSCIQLSAPSCIIKKSIIKGKHFDESISSSEDILFLNNLFLINPIIGYIREAIYFYRRRVDSSSVIQNTKKSFKYHFNSINYVAHKLINNSNIIFNKIIPFIQFYIGYDILCRITQSSFQFLAPDSFQKYCLIIESLLKSIEDKYILGQRILSKKLKIFTLSKKYNKDLRYDIKLKNNDSFRYLNHIIINLKAERLIIWKILEIKKNILHLEGIDNCWLPKETFSFLCKVGKKNFYPSYELNSNYDFITMYGVIEKGRIIKFNIPIDSQNIIKFYISYDGLKIEIFTSLGYFTHIPPLNSGYYISENYILKYIDNRIHIFLHNKKLEIEFEKNFCDQLKIRNKSNIIKLRKHIKHKNQIRNHKDKKIWIVNDKHNKAGGNGEYFFRYLKLKKPKEVKSYFVIERNCSDYKRIKQLGDILDLYSYRYKNIFLQADKMISSLTDSLIENPFHQDHIYIRDLIKFDIIYLENRITKDDLSKYFNKFNKNYILFVTSLKNEYKSIFEYKYGYDKDNVILAGSPRFDKLELYKNKDNNKKGIIIFPTWRKNIEGTRDLITHESIYYKAFIFTEFFNFYNNLINNRKLLSFMKQHNYTGTLCLDSFFRTQYIDFNKNEIFSIMKDCENKDFIYEYSLLITDYSSIFFDFGYLKKPIIYTHFDYEEYRNTHYPKGYFDYERDGFGPICKDIKCTVNEVILSIKNNCKLRKKFLRRIYNIYSYNISNSNERIYKILTKNIDKSKIKNEKKNNSTFAVIIYFINLKILYKLLIFIIFKY